MNARAPRPTLRDLQARLDQVARENALLADSLAILAANTHQVLGIATSQFLALRDLLVAQNVVTAEDVTAARERAELERLLELPAPAPQDGRPRG